MSRSVCLEAKAKTSGLLVRISSHVLLGQESEVGRMDRSLPQPDVFYSFFSLTLARFDGQI